MKKALLLFSLLCASTVYADQTAVSQFLGINDNESSAIISDSNAQDLLNVDVTPNGKSVKKRLGYGLYKSLGTGQAIHGGYHFYNTGGSDVQLWGSSTSIYGITSDATPIQIVSSATLNATWQCADTQGSAYCVDSNRDVLLKTDGASIQQWMTSPLGTMVAITPDRLVVAGVSGSRNTLFMSQANVFNNFTVGINPTDPFTEVIAAPGASITHIRYGCQKLLWWKNSSFGYLTGSNQFDLGVVTVNDSIGTVDNSSAIDPGGTVWFRGQDGHIYSYDCSALRKESIDITPLTQASGNRTANSWTQSTNADFNGGSGTFIDTTTFTNQIALTGYRENWSNLGKWTVSKGTAVVSNSTVLISTSGPGGSPLGSARVSYSSTTIAISSAVPVSFSFSANTVLLGNLSVRLLDASNNGYTFDANYNTPTFVSYSSFRADAGTLAGGSGCTAATLTSDFATHTVGLTRSTTGFTTLVIDSSYTCTYNDSTYFGYNTPVIITSATSTSPLTTFAIGPYKVLNTTGSYSSAVKNAPNLTAWDTITMSDTQTGTGAINYFTRSSTNPFTVLSSTPVLVAQAKSALVAASTGTYFQLIASFTATASNPDPRINSFTFNWFEGSASDKAYAFYFDNAIWFSVAYGAGQASNNRIFKQDLINKTWLVYDIGTGGMLQQGQSLYFGSTTTANTFKYGSGTSDNGTAINAYWRSKDFGGQDPWLENQYNQLDSYYKTNANQTIGVSYYLNTSTTSTSYTVNLSSNTQSVIRNKKLLPNGKNGGNINIQFGDNSTSSQWELLGFRFMFNPLPYRPTQ